MKALLVRVGIDGKFGGWNAPIDSTNRFIYVPIPEDHDVKAGYETLYDQFKSACAAFGVNMPTRLLQYKSSHLDQDFENLTYGHDRKRAGPFLGLIHGDLTVFYAGLRPIGRASAGNLVYAIIGLIVVDRVQKTSDFTMQDLFKKAHTRRQVPDDDIFVIGESGGRLERCIPIGSYYDKGYRIRNDVLTEWGGLLKENGAPIKNSYIQRGAALPHFANAEKSRAWFKAFNIPLVIRNNLD